MPKTRHLRLQYVLVAEGMNSNVNSFNAKVQWSQIYSDELLCVLITMPELLHFHGIRLHDSGKIRFILIIELQRLAKSDNILVITSSHVKVLINNIHMVSTLGSRIAWLVWKFKILHLQWCRSLISSALSWDHLVSFWHSGHNSAWCATNVLSLCISFTNYNIVWPSTLPKLCSNWLQCLQKNEISV